MTDEHRERKRTFSDLVERVVTVGDDDNALCKRHDSVNPSAFYVNPYLYPYSSEPSTFNTSVVTAQIAEAWKAAAAAAVGGDDERGKNNNNYWPIDYLSNENTQTYSAYAYQDRPFTPYSPFFTAYHQHPAHYYAIAHPNSVYSSGQELSNDSYCHSQFNPSSSSVHLQHHFFASFPGQSKHYSQKEEDFLDRNETNVPTAETSNSRLIKKKRNHGLEEAKTPTNMTKNHHDSYGASSSSEENVVQKKLRPDKKKTIVVIPNDDDIKERDRIKKFQKNSLLKLAQWILDTEDLNEFQEIVAQEHLRTCPK